LIKRIYWFLFMYDLNESGERAPSVAGSRSLKGILMQDLSYVVLFSYTFFILAPVMPLVADLVAHTFWEKDHLSTAHHLYGNNHVSREVQKAENQTGKETGSNGQKAGMDDLVHRPESNLIYDLKPSIALTQTFIIFNASCAVAYPDIDYPPPRL